MKRVRWLKDKKEGNEIMCEIMDGIREEGIRLGEKRGERRGEKRATKNMLNIVNHLLEEGNVDSIIRLQEDKTFLKEMKKKYQLI